MALSRDGSTVQLATRIARDLHRRVHVDALERNLTLSEWITDALTTHLERVKGGKPAKSAAKATT